MPEQIRATINGEERELRVDLLEPLSNALRREVGLYSVRETCGVGVCGVCAVLVDDRVVSACLTPSFAIDGACVSTVEGLAGERELDAVQDAFVSENAFQCSFCTPAFIMSVHALLRENTKITEDDIGEYLSGVLCRCGSYEAILNAVRRVTGAADTGGGTHGAQ